VRLRNLMEDKSERELNIFTWRDDVKELLQSLDQDGDNRLSAAERDAATSLLDRLIPQVDMSNPSSEAPRSRSTASSGRERNSGSNVHNSGDRGGYGYGGTGS